MLTYVSDDNREHEGKMTNQHYNIPNIRRLSLTSLVAMNNGEGLDTSALLIQIEVRGGERDGVKL